MKRIKSAVCALAAATTLAASMPAASLAEPVYIQRPEIGVSAVEQVKNKYKYNGYYNGHYYGRGYVYRGYPGRYYGGYNNYNYWAPGAAFLGGAIIGGILAAPRYYGPPRYYAAPPRYYGGNVHVSWCYNHYRSYREWDNTFQPYHGPRRACRSPYYR